MEMNRTGGTTEGRRASMIRTATVEREEREEARVFTAMSRRDGEEEMEAIVQVTGTTVRSASSTMWTGTKANGAGSRMIVATTGPNEGSMENAGSRAFRERAG